METNFFKKNSAYVRYCCIIPTAVIPADILTKDSDLASAARRDGRCFARVLRRTSWNSFQVSVAADPRHLDNEKRSHLVEIAATALPADVRVDSLMGAAIPRLLLDEDTELRRMAEEHGECPAWVECQLSWDLYRVRIAPDIHRLYDKERSHVLYLSCSELQAYIRFLPEQQMPDSTLAAFAPQVISEPQKSVDFTPLEPVDVPEEDIKAAVETVDIPQDMPFVQLLFHGSKWGRRLQRIVELVLYRAVLRAVAHKKTLQGTIRRVLVLRNQFHKRLICIRDMYEIDHHTYWSVQIFLPKSFIQISVI